MSAALLEHRCPLPQSCRGARELALLPGRMADVLERPAGTPELIASPIELQALLEHGQALRTVLRRLPGACEHAAIVQQRTGGARPIVELAPEPQRLRKACACA